jgi:acetyl-CoA C-acetyltransferase
MSPATTSAVVLGGNRTPFVKAGGAYAAASDHDLLTAALNGLVARYPRLRPAAGVRHRP